MNAGPNPRAALGCLPVILVAMVIAALITASSFNPFAVYSSDSATGKAIVSLLLGFVVLVLLQLLMWGAVRKQVSLTSHRRADDVVCPGCGNPLLTFTSAYGFPITCPKCRRSWHNGPVCYNRDRPQPRIMVPKWECPACREAAASDDRDLFPL